MESFSANMASTAFPILIDDSGNVDEKINCDCVKKTFATKCYTMKRVFTDTAAFV